MSGQKKIWIGMGIALLISLSMHLPFLHVPPHSQHVWRQTFTLTIAENFFEESMNIFAPRVNQRFDTDGVSGTQFPLYEWVLAHGYSIFGNKYWVHRIWSWLLTALGALAIFKICGAWWKDQWVSLSAFTLYLFSPELFYDGWIALPDTMALALCLWGLHFYQAYHAGKKTLLLWLSAVLFMLGGAVKLQYLGIGFLIAGMLIRDYKGLNIKELLRLGIFGGIAVLPPLAWYRYSAALIKKSGFADFGLELKPAESLDKALSVLKKNLISDIPEVMLGYVAFVGFLVALYLFIKRRGKTKHPLFIPILVFVLGYTVYHLLELRVLEHHQYYMLPYLAVLIPLAARGLVFLSRGKVSILVALLAAQVIVCGFRMIPARFTHPDKHIPTAFWNESSRESLRQSVPDSSLVMAGPDKSMCIYLYFLHKKGWTYNEKDGLLKPVGEVNYLHDAILRGCEYLITTHTDLEKGEVKPYLKEQIYFMDGVSVYRLQLPSE